VGEPLQFRTDLYRGTADWYERYRLPYPAALLDDLLARVGANGDGRLLDLACGTGRLTFPLAQRFADVLAVDLEPDAIARATERAAERGVTNVRFAAGRAEDVDVDTDGAFDLVTIGTAFHRLDRPRVAELAMGWLRDGGHLALVWSDAPWTQDGDWQRALSDCAFEWSRRMDPVERVPAGIVDAITELPHDTVLTDAGFTLLDRLETTVVHDFSVDDLIGLVYSTSILPRPLLGDRAPEFEAEVRARLLAVVPSGVFRDQPAFAYDLAVRPRR
jgi:SAM-dependent methyltransferase